jgi:hypothetical protein
MISSARTRGALGALAFSASLAACSAPGRPPQSPANDTPPPVTSTGHGDMMGAETAPAQPPDGPKLDSKDGKPPAPTP